MDIHKPERARLIGAPKDWDPAKDGDCQALPVVDHLIGGSNYMRSYWRPTPAEMAALDEGGFVILDVRGQKHPVIAMGVEPIAPVPLESASRRIAIAIAGAVEAMLESQRKASPGSYLAVSPCQVGAGGVSIRWGLVKDPTNVAPDFAHWTMIGPIGAEGSSALDLPKILGVDMDPKGTADDGAAE
jgi:hypothetical protein